MYKEDHTSTPTVSYEILFRMFIASLVTSQPMVIITSQFDHACVRELDEANVTSSTEVSKKGPTILCDATITIQ